MGTMFGDIFIDDDAINANSWIESGAGDDIIIAGALAIASTPARAMTL